MTEFNVIFNGRQMGKTYTIMTEIHDLIVAGRATEVLIVFPAVNWVHWWVREWQSRFPFVPMVDYTTINNNLNVRGKRYSKIYVEDVGNIDDGVHNNRLEDIFMTLLSPFNDEEVVFTCSPIELNQRSHNGRVTKADVFARYKK